MKNDNSKRKKSKKNPIPVPILIGILTVFIVLVLISIFLILRKKQDGLEKKIEIINIYTSFSNESALHHFQDEIDIFTNLEQGYQINVFNSPLGDLEKRYRSGELQMQPDLIVSSTPLTDHDEIRIIKTQPWYGNFWVIYYNKSVLKSAGIDTDNKDDERSRSLINGGLDRESFFTLLHEIKNNGFIPITVGGKFGWPLAVWIQHLAAYEGGTIEAASMLSEDFSTDSAAYLKALQDFSEFIANGWIWERFAESDWPPALQPLIDGKAAFCLLNKSLVTSIPFEKRDRIGLVRFPLSASGDGINWSVGSMVYLSLLSPGQSNAKLETFYEFLFSEGVTSRLSRKLLIPFFTGPKEGGEQNESGVFLIPSITSNPNSPIIRDIREYLVNIQ